MAHTYPYNRKSSCANFIATVTLYIQVTQILDLHVETTSPYTGHTSHSSFHDSILLPGYSVIYQGYPKILHWLCLTLLTALALWGAPYERPRQVGAPRSTPTYYPRCMHVHLLSVYYPKMGSDMFLLKT